MPYPVQYCAEQLHQMWASGVSNADIAAALGCSESFVTKLARRHRLPRRQKPPKEIFENDPTPEQIAERAAEIRARHMAEMRALG